MKTISTSLAKLAIEISLLFAISQLVVATGQTNSSSQVDVKLQSDLDQQTDVTLLRNSTLPIGQQPVGGRSMVATRDQSARAGRMLDLDRLAGDIGRDEKLAREHSLSGNRQSRVLSEDLPLASNEKLEARAHKSKGGKKMAIKGFIPIVSLDNGKHLESQLESEDESDDSSEQADEQQHQANTLRDQLAVNYGGQTSIGHASFGAPTAPQHGQQSDATGQWDQQEAGRANRKLLGTSNILSGLTNSKRFASSLVPSAAFAQSSYLLPDHHQLQAPMNVPPVASYFDQRQTQSGSDCICVPFFQCKNGFLSESQLSKSQLAQISQNLHHQQVQIPRSLANQNLHQTQPNDLYYTSRPPMVAGAPQQQQQFPSQPNDQQVANDIYEQLRKSIEQSDIEQQLQQSGVYQSALVNERSKSGSAANASSAEAEERSLLKPLASRRNSYGQQKCGIMRTCCRVPATLLQHHQLAAHPQAVPRFVVGQPGQVSPARPQLAASMAQPAEYQMLQPARHNSFVAQPPAGGQLNQMSDYLSASATLAQAAHPSSNQMSALAEQQVGPRPPGGSFMAGRCGTRQTLGISGRVQNAQAAQQGVEDTADFGEFPAHAAILKRLSPGDSLFVCSAVLVSSEWLATAAHCVKRHRPDELKVRLGEWDVNRDDEFYPFVEANVREIVLHPDFQPTSLANDVALLRLEVAVDQQQVPHVAPACLAHQDEQQHFAGQRCWVAGWGKNAFGQLGTFQSVLKKVDLPVVSHRDCEMALRFQTKLGKFFRLHVNNICAGGEGGKDACEGDGGAGLYCLDPQSGLTKVIGLVSWGVGCGQRGVPGVYVNMANFYTWIESVVASSGEENIYLDGRQQSPLEASNFKNIISERTINGTTIETNSSKDAAGSSHQVGGGNATH